MKIREGIDPETGEKIRILDPEIPNSSDIVTGNVWGWNKTKPKTHWFFRILLFFAVIGILASVINAAYILTF